MNVHVEKVICNSLQSTSMCIVSSVEARLSVHLQKTRQKPCETQYTFPLQVTRMSWEKQK